jgi:hypothetical protein
LRQAVWVALAGDQGVHHGAPGDFEDVGGHAGQLDLGRPPRVSPPAAGPGSGPR